MLATSLFAIALSVDKLSALAPFSPSFTDIVKNTHLVVRPISVEAKNLHVSFDQPVNAELRQRV